MNIPNDIQVAIIARRYPVWCRVELIKSNSPKAPPAGTHGTVRGVDSAGNIAVDCDNGTSFTAVYGVDYCMRCK